MHPAKLPLSIIGQTHNGRIMARENAWERRLVSGVITLDSEYSPHRFRWDEIAVNVAHVGNRLGFSVGFSRS
jgi:hypothetical protein